uniref:DUF6824 domain-containing protein n=1 Tax=Grammatophora oceanica TaxID=210454 RepID=A0A7S1USB0_9STRA|mmetsp:Transcript_17517/g.25949  ORF Transcript_17517/g.25949 Transcript_17517/m.25949 type:complete len:377 (+) Transcript_17517:94-1224(+)|eukprot:CAMPEP_0194027360 /NCGR_PEP_ID=MMETSP0009_2-20130614/1521_1 /TAXON_ID=210454 /ORGANISM="Grammatophora oceanica, Strain CCMP 410" /LENGTH=376 /DNA_ID=CAMNT_0038666403 /DNA_START=92 /DNA_END=1222 /DNA_ORIENTATION=+
MRMSPPCSCITHRSQADFPIESSCSVVDCFDPQELVDCEAKGIMSTGVGKIVPHENDVLMGRGGKNNQHVGNEKLRALARGQSENYRMSSKKGKSYISRELVKDVRNMSPPGRFLKKQANGEWIDVGDEVAREKASQVLRDAVAVCSTSPTDATEKQLDKSMETMATEHRRSSSAPPAIHKGQRRRRDWEDADDDQNQQYVTPRGAPPGHHPPVTPSSSSAKRRRYYDSAWVEHEHVQHHPYQYRYPPHGHHHPPPPPPPPPHGMPTPDYYGGHGGRQHPNYYHYPPAAPYPPQQPPPAFATAEPPHPPHHREARQGPPTKAPQPAYGPPVAPTSGAPEATTGGINEFDLFEGGLLDDEETKPPAGDGDLRNSGSF